MGRHRCSFEHVERRDGAGNRRNHPLPPENICPACYGQRLHGIARDNLHAADGDKGFRRFLFCFLVTAVLGAAGKGKNTHCDGGEGGHVKGVHGGSH